MTLIPYHGQSHEDEEEIYRSISKSDTPLLHAYGTAAVVHKGHRYTLALTHVVYGESMKDIVQRLFAPVLQQGVKIKYLLLNDGFFSVAVISYLKRARHAFIIPAVALVCWHCVGATQCVGVAAMQSREGKMRRQSEAVHRAIAF